MSYYKVKQQSFDPDVYEIAHVKLVKGGWRHTRVIRNLSRAKAEAIKVILDSKDSDL